jgi:3-methyladenine DNA glycosylase AlkD
MNLSPSSLNILYNWKQDLLAVGNTEKIKVFMRYFKTGKGEYGEGDKFIGASVPDVRNVSKKYATVPLEIADRMIRHEIHEFRLAALLSLVERYRLSRHDTASLNKICSFYISHSEFINNWDLVDLSAPKIIGEELRQRRHTNTIRELSVSEILWQRRIAIVSTLQPTMKDGVIDDAIYLSNTLISDNENLMQKAVGWVLREVGKKNRTALDAFLSSHIKQISATTLSYAIEKFSPDERKYWRQLRKSRL